MSSVISLKNIMFSWSKSAPVLNIENLEINSGERIFLYGSSGSGKSTLLGLLAGIQIPDAGQIEVLGHNLAHLKAVERDNLRAARLGVIFQMFNLLPFLNVVQNVTLACAFSSERKRRIEGAPEKEAKRLLARLGLKDASLLERRVSDLSVGQQQRVAVARALLGCPDLVLADEPTSALDQDARDDFISLLIEETTRSGATLVFVSHDRTLAPHFDRALDLSDLNRVTK